MHLGRGRVGPGRVDDAAEQVDVRATLALVGHVVDGRAGLLFQQLGVEVGGRALAPGGAGDAALGLGPGHVLLHPRLHAPG